MTSSDAEAQAAVQEFWNEAPCGEAYFVGDTPAQRSAAITATRYGLEPYIATFAVFEAGRDADVLEVGVGVGTDHCQWARSNPRSLSGIDLTARSVELTKSQLQANDLTSALQVGDARSLPFPDESFDIVYSWGVLHHSADTPTTVAEVWRVLRPGGVAKIMIYNKRSITGALLWLRYGLLARKPRTTLADIYSQHLESPGTKAFTAADAELLFSQFSRLTSSVELAPGDLLTGVAGQRHGGLLLRSARRVWPRALIRRFGSDFGLYLLLTAEK